MAQDGLRRQDFTLDDDQRAVQESFRDFFSRESPASVVRAAEPLGFDAGLWAKLAGMGAASMGLPESAGGDGATLIDLVLVAEECGRAVAPVPFLAHTAASRFLAAAGASADVLAEAVAGERVFTLAFRPVRDGVRQLVPEAAIARGVVGCTADSPRLYTSEEPVRQVPNHGSTPLGWWFPGDPSVALGTQGQFGTAVAEYKLLLAAALTGIADSALQLGAEFAKTRRTLGVAIGSLQGVAYPLVEVAMAVAGARNLVRKAAWYSEHEPTARPELPLAAFDYAVRAATEAVTVSAHVQGGLGFTVEADISLFFLRAKGWGVLAGDPAADRRHIGATFLETV